MLAFLILCLILLGAIGLIHTHWNRKRDKQDTLDAQSMYSPLCQFTEWSAYLFLDGVVHDTIENEEFADLTDFKIRSFRYPI